MEEGDEEEEEEVILLRRFIRGFENCCVSTGMIDKKKDEPRTPPFGTTLPETTDPALAFTPTLPLLFPVYKKFLLKER